MTPIQQQSDLWKSKLTSVTPQAAETSLLFSPSFSPLSILIFLQQNRPGFQRGALGCTVPLTVGMQFLHKLLAILGRVCSLIVGNTHNQLVCSTPRPMLQIGLLLATWNSDTWTGYQKVRATCIMFFLLFAAFGF